MPLNRPTPSLLHPRENVEEVRQFFDHWALYQKIAGHNYLGHQEAYSKLREVLKTRLSLGFSLIDLGCGDASFMASILKDTAIQRYDGVDISSEALSLARKNMAVIQAQKSFTQEDFCAFVQKGSSSAEVIWIGLSLHHLSLEQKSSFIARCFKVLTKKGFLMIYDPMLKESESRKQFVERWWGVCQSRWTALTPDEKDAIHQHVQSADYPETLSTYQTIGKTHGFQRVASIFAENSGIYETVVFEK